MRLPPDHLHTQGLYIAHLAQRVEALDRCGGPPPVAYRLFARRLELALAGYPEVLAVRLGSQLPCVLHALAQRYFEVHGTFEGAAAARARQAAWRLFRKLGCKARR
jgi:hypothetical protein